MRHHSLLSLCVMLATCAVSGTSLRAEDELYAPMPADVARTRCLDWAAGQGLMEREQIEAVGRLWATGQTPVDADTLHRRTLQTFALVRPAIGALIAQCDLRTAGAANAASLTDAALLQDESLDPFLRANLRSHVGQHLAQAGLYDEALEVLEGVDAGQLVNPAAYFFFRSVSEHSLLRKDAGLKSLKTLLQNTSDVPVRYTSVAELMQADLEKLEDKSLDEIARMMRDVERRLNLGRGGARVQKEEEEIVARLDELIKKLEEQARNGGGSGNGDANSNAKPAQDSVIKGSTAPGEVDERDIGDRAGWGALPPKQQAKARNLIDRELPPHYRNAIEQYLKKLAGRPQAPSR